MDPQDKQRFEIHGKSSVKYHLKANHQVEAKRWYWALNNAIRWSKDEAKEDEKRQNREVEALKQAKMEQFEKRPSAEGDSLSVASSRAPSKMNLAPCMLSLYTLLNPPWPSQLTSFQRFHFSFGTWHIKNRSEHCRR
jgi:hypothetical protein